MFSFLKQGAQCVKSFILLSSFFSFFIPAIGNTESILTQNSPNLVSRSIFFNDPDHTNVQTSPDGKWLSYLAPHQGVLNIWVGDLKDEKTLHPITDNSKRGIAGYFWAYTNRHVIYVDDHEGNEDWRIYRVDVQTGEKLTLASFNKVQARIVALSQYIPNEILISLNQRRPDFHDVYRLNILTGQLTLILENDSFANFVCDDHLNLKVARESTEDGGAKYYTFKLDPNNKYSTKELFSVSQEDMFTTAPLLIDKTGNTLYMFDGRGRNTAALFSFDLNTQKTNLMAENDLVDITDVLVHPENNTIQGTATIYERKEWTLLDKTLGSDFKYLKQIMNADMEIVSRSLDDKTWIVAYLRDDGASHYYYYDKPNQKAQFLFSGRAELDKTALTKMDPVVIRSRDNLSLVSYLSLPLESRVGVNKVKTPVPLVLLVHGGPSARDMWGFNPIHQWLANRGYAVLSVNYRGSTGFGKKFVNAGNGEWGGKMHDDLVDAVNWAIQQGITTRDKVAIMGGSYGGYATLVGMTKTPELFACGIDIVGPSNLETLLRSIPPYWKPYYALLKVTVGGDPETEKGREFLASRSPLTFVNNIKKPLLIGQGANDPRVKQAESDQIVKAMQEKNIPVTYVLYADEGHGFRRPENRLSFYAVAESFLAKNLGGRYEPIENAFQNSSIEIKEGKQDILGLN